MRFSSINYNQYLYEGLDTSEQHSVMLWESAGYVIREANLSPAQITSLFQKVEQGLTAAGTNRTALGKGKDAASAVNAAWEDLKTKIQNSKPIAGIDAKYDQVAEKLKRATGGDQGVMKYVQKYRDFAQKHPVAQSFIYAALIAAAGISGAGLGGAAALGLLKMTDKLLQGEKFSSAAYAGLKTGVTAFAASKLGEYIKDTWKTYSSNNRYFVNGVETDRASYEQAVKAIDAQAKEMGIDPNNFGPKETSKLSKFIEQNADKWQGDSVPPGGGVKATDYAMDNSRPSPNEPFLKKPNPNLPSDVTQSDLKADKKLLKDLGLGNKATTGDVVNAMKKQGWDQDWIDSVKNGTTPPAETPTGAGTEPTAGMTDKEKIAKGLMKDPQADLHLGAENTPTISQDEFDARKREISARINKEMEGEPFKARNKAFLNDPEYKKLKADFEAGQEGSRKAFDKARDMTAGMDTASIHRTAKALSEGQVYLVFKKICEEQLTEGPLDALKGLGSKVKSKLQTVGKNITTKVTADKLNKAWQKAGQPTDTDDVAELLKAQGVDPAVISKVYRSMRLPAPGNKALRAEIEAIKAEITKLKPAQQQKLLYALQRQLGGQP